MALNQNQFSISTLKGTKDSGVSVSGEFYSATPTDVLTAGECVVIAATSAPGVTKVSQSAVLTLKSYGVVLTNPLKDSFAVGDKIEVGIIGCIVMMEASAAIVAGASVQYDPATKKIATKASTNTIVGLALESAAADGDLIRVLVNTIY